MGGDYSTHVKNEYKEVIKIVVTHANNRNDIIRIYPGETRTVETNGGCVCVCVYVGKEEYPYECINKYSGYSVVVREDENGLPRVVSA